MSESWIRLAAIAAGGALGATMRYGVGVVCAGLWGDKFGVATLLVNVTGCFVLGLLMHDAWAPISRGGGAWHAAATVGLLGGLTTFSTFGYQTIRHLDAGEPLLAVANVGLNVTLGLVAAAAGLALSRQWWPIG
ncbi:camphor resistance protein CrcB [Botrimarina colliarenosi]|uniref:Fluoride-specific ion channel FluC n=1 Tax=Botrimarina colliarenosi TaxID=2528001 RepID=A0A5C6A7A8_9BACT|nr:CrcB family protein [Botrimarina colliarenosi]TWT95257.1 camphor resistance protein CrcB [Botrimarina colliarenosi]